MSTTITIIIPDDANVEVKRPEPPLATWERELLANPPPLPMDNVTRRAVFSALRRVYGDLSDDDRLDIVSVLVGRQIHSMSRSGNMTLDDAHRVLNVLDTIPE